LAGFAKNFVFSLRLDLFLPQRTQRKIRKEHKGRAFGKPNGNLNPHLKIRMGHADFRALSTARLGIPFNGKLKKFRIENFK
jgi:hypothetical protein